MSPLSPLPAIACLLVAVATAFLLERKFGAPQPLGRFTTIDGLRGYLAFFVFMHHSSVWYFYLRTDQWTVPPSNLYGNFGRSSVLIFFMITGFLFFSKLIDGRTRSIDWGKLFVSRFLRLVPLYLFAMFLLFLLVAIVSGWAMNESIPELLDEVIAWLAFTIPGVPNLNGVNDTFAIIAWVTWSLPYEWLFYFSLPLLALAVGVIPPFIYIVLSIVGVTALAVWDPDINLMLLIPFLSGMAAAMLVRLNLFRQFATRKISSIILLGCIATAVAFYPVADEPVPFFLLTAAFILIACGNSLFGVLTSPASRTLGEMAYSLYLLHGITLFVTFYFILGEDNSRALSPVAHWLVVAGITPVLVSLCFFTFRHIESPAMRSTTTFTAWLRSRLTPRTKAITTNERP